MLVRLLTVAVTAIGGAAIARRLADTVVEKRVNSEIAHAKEDAIRRLSAEAGALSRRRLAEFCMRTLKKVLILGFFAGLYHAGEITAAGARIILVSTIAFMLAGDVARIARPLWIGLKRLRNHRWRADEALKEFVAALAFEEAYQRSLTQLTSPQISPVLFVSSFTRVGLSGQIADAISEVAHDATIKQLRPHLIFFAFAAMIIMLVYTAFVVSTFGSIDR